MGRLFNFQEDGVRFLSSRGRVGLFDEMGLGKSVQALSSLAESGDVRPALIICPKSLISEWILHVREWLPGWQPYLAAETNEEGWQALNSEAGLRSIGLINYASLHKLPQPLPYWSVVIVDEAHYVKNRKAQRSRWVRSLTRNGRCERVFLLTGTPYLYQPHEMWHLLHVIDSRTFSSYWRFFTRHVKYWTGPNNAKIPTGVRDLEVYLEDVGPYFLRRRKAEVLQDLPPLIINRLPAQLGPNQRKMYDTVLNEKLVTPEGEPYNFPNILAKLTALRKLATSPYVVDPDLGDDEHPKVDVLSEKINSLTTPAVVFTHFRRTKELVLKRLSPRATDLRGLEAWREGGYQVLVDTTYKGGLGLNLQNASDAFFIEPPSGHVFKVQAEARLQRPGGKHDSYTIWRMYSEDTIDVHFWTHLQRLGAEAREVDLAWAVWNSLLEER